MSGGVADKTESGGVVEVCRDGPSRYRWECPYGHTDWQLVSQDHVWCRGCARRGVHRGRSLDPRHWQIVDKKEGRTIPIAKIEVTHS